ncbi:J domain-containing protein [Aggregicoccus sp. 17bor-14]|uniref:J domain-containing protein n=1 Tax=Myxococcaceae TaxID=31 RepID=UPI00129D04B7|nr:MULTISPECIES: J domain-containing protein [Myxococcaceae]MBF5041152.1 J domain-containing protein [Simulacricoccus sp. 17bor-14]MRI86939.1 J domain-containing protein [Aggregicoccus sp. 17bor-14]
MTATVAAWQTLEGVDVECTHCGVRMTMHAGARVKYFRCGSCHRWVSSTYTDIFRADAKMRTHPVKEAPESAGFIEVKDRLERWLTQLEDQDPYRVLGVSPLDSAETVRNRYRELAMERHPDRGGSAERMRELNAAYERILRHRERKRAEALSSGSSTLPGALPARSR